MQNPQILQERPLLQIVPNEVKDEHLTGQLFGYPQLDGLTEKYYVITVFNLEQCKKAVTEIYNDFETLGKEIMTIGLDTEGVPLSMINLGYRNAAGKFKIYLFHIAFFATPYKLGDLIKILQDKWIKKVGVDIMQDIERIFTYMNVLVKNVEDSQLTALEKNIDINQGNVASMDSLVSHLDIFKGKLPASETHCWNQHLGLKAITYCCNDVFLSYKIHEVLTGNINNKIVANIPEVKEKVQLSKNNEFQISDAELRTLADEYFSWLTATMRKSHAVWPMDYNSAVNLSLNGFSPIAKQISDRKERIPYIEKLINFAIFDKKLVRNGDKLMSR